MSGSRIDPNVERFIADCINSVEQLEILLLMRSRKELDIETITIELRTSSGSVEKRLSDLMRKNLITSRSVADRQIFIYDPPASSGETIELLATFYASHRVTIINLIFSRPPDALKGFSDAFRF